MLVFFGGGEGEGVGGMIGAIDEVGEDGVLEFEETEFVFRALFALLNLARLCVSRWFVGDHYGGNYRNNLD